LCVIKFFLLSKQTRPKQNLRGKKIKIKIKNPRYRQIYKHGEKRKEKLNEDG